jgi:predicted Rossmann-fold nucleotide-binding protein
MNDRKMARKAGAAKMAAERRAIERIIRFKNLPYNPFRVRLYTVRELMGGYDPAHPGRSLDERIAKHFNGRAKSGRAHPSVHEALAQRIHDHAIDSALYRFAQPAGKPRRKLVGIMGGHSLARDQGVYLLVATLGWSLCREGYSVVTGGGPGVMEAANLGAYLSGYPLEAVNAAVEVLGRSPDYSKDPIAYVDAATQIRKSFSKDSGESLAIPTWAYANEPTGQFSSAVGKYFANSIREDGLLAIASDGVVFAPGSEGTMQEVFQDACHNAYWTFGTRAPMVFLNTSDYFTRPPSIFDVVQAQAGRQKPPYASLVTVCKDIPPIVKFIKANPPTPKPGAPAVRTFGLTNLELA